MPRELHTPRATTADVTITMDDGRVFRYKGYVHEVAYRFSESYFPEAFPLQNDPFQHSRPRPENPSIIMNMTMVVNERDAVVSVQQAAQAMERTRRIEL